MCWAAPLPTLYIGGEGRLCPHQGFHPRGGGQHEVPSEGRPREGEGKLAPQVRWVRPLPQTLGALGPCGGAHQPTWGWSPPTLGPCSPPGMVAPLGGPAGPSRWSQYVTDKTQNFSGDQNRTSHI